MSKKAAGAAALACGNAACGKALAPPLLHFSSASSSFYRALASLVKLLVKLLLTKKSFAVRAKKLGSFCDEALLSTLSRRAQASKLSTKESLRCKTMSAGKRREAAGARMRRRSGARCTSGRHPVRADTLTGCLVSRGVASFTAAVLPFA